MAMPRSVRRFLCSALIPLLFGVSACATLSGQAEKDVRMAEVQYDLGVTALQNGKFESAIPHLLKAISLDPKMFYAHNALGLVWWKKDRLDDAQACFENAVRIKPDFSDGWNNIGALAMQRHDLAKAKTAFEKVLADPVYSTPYVTRANLGWLYHMQGDDKAALAQLREALAIDESYCAAHKFTAALYEESGKKDDAALAWKEFARVCPEEPEALYQTGRMQLEDGDAQGAARSFARCQAYARKINRDHVFIKTCAMSARGLPPLSPEEQAQIAKITEPTNAPPMPEAKDIR